MHFAYNFFLSHFTSTELFITWTYSRLSITCRLKNFFLWLWAKKILYFWFVFLVALRLFFLTISVKSVRNAANQLSVTRLFLVFHFVIVVAVYSSSSSSPYSLLLFFPAAAVFHRCDGHCRKIELFFTFHTPRWNFLFIIYLENLIIIRIDLRENEF